MIFEGKTIILTDEQASSHFGDDWFEYFRFVNVGSIFFDGHEVQPCAIRDGICDRLELESVYDVEFEAIYD